ncbi:MAG: tetratricopeptide repeat protein, partial [Phycisphaerae bacterium]
VTERSRVVRPPGAARSWWFLIGLSGVLSAVILVTAARKRTVATEQRIAELAAENARLRSELSQRAAPEVVGDDHVAPPAQLSLTGEESESGDAVPVGPPRSDPVGNLQEALAGFVRSPETSVRARLFDRLAAAEQAYAVSGGSPPLLDVALRSAIALNDGSSALLWLERSLGSEVGAAPPNLDVALTALRMSSQVDPQRRLAVIEPLLRTYASSVPLRLHEAQAMTDAGRRTEAYALLDDVAAANSAVRSGVLAEAIAVGPAEAHCGAARRLSAILLQDGGRPAEAVQVWRDLVRGDALDAEAHDRLGVALNQIGDDASALEAFEKALICEPRAVRAGFHRATALANLGRIEEAIKAFQQVIAENSEAVAEVRFALAVCLAKGGQMRDAEVELARALAQDPDLADLALKIPAVARLLDVEQ